MPSTPASPPPPPRPSRPGGASSPQALERFVDRGRVERLLAPWIPDAADRAFVSRCLLDEGPAHHRGANWILLCLLGELVGPAVAPDVSAEVRPIPMRLPPHLRPVAEPDDAFPLTLPVEPLRRLAAGDERAVDAMIECLTDGPPQHALANAAMVHLLHALLCR
jgi:hypothetical protein